jgi:hypothetical protein
MGNFKRFLAIPALLAVAISAFASEPAPTKQAMTGTWLLNGKDKTIRIVLKGDGTFDYSGQAATSKGRWAVNGSKLKFNWTHIDGSKVKPNTVVGNFPIQNRTFKIGKYVYAKPGTTILVAQK